MRHFTRILLSSYRSHKRQGLQLTNRSYPIWTESENHWRFQWATYIIGALFNEEIAFVGGTNIEVLGDK